MRPPRPDNASRIPHKRGRAYQRWFREYWGDLSDYNAEVARGIVHTDEWVRYMGYKQEFYDEVFRP